MVLALVVILGILLLALEVVGLIVLWRKLDTIELALDDKLNIVKSYAEEGQTACKTQRRIAEKAKTVVQEAMAAVEQTKAVAEKLPDEVAQRVKGDSNQGF